MEIYENEKILSKVFIDAQDILHNLIKQLQSKQYQSMEHDDVEKAIHRDGFEMMRLLLQGHLDSRFEREQDLGEVTSEGHHHDYYRAKTSRVLNSIFGTHANWGRSKETDSLTDTGRMQDKDPTLKQSAFDWPGFKGAPFCWLKN